MATIEVAGRKVEYVLEGQGELVVLSSPTWWPLGPWKLSGLPELREEFRVLAFNHRGIGGSDATSGEYSIPGFAEDTAELMDALGLDRGHILGFANGSTVALEAARQQPTRFHSIVIAAMGSMNALRDGRRFVPQGLVTALKEQGHEAYIRHHAQDDFAFSKRSRVEHPERGQELADALWEHAGPEEEFIKHTMARQGHDAFAGLTDLRQPLLVMVGSDDNVARGEATPAKVAQTAASLVLHSKLAVFPGVKHMLFWEEPEASWARVRGFLRQAGKGP